jgi:hypothetical protein
MKRKLLILLVGFGLAATALATAEQAWATLGESVDSITLDSHTLSAVRSAATVSGNYTVHELHSDAISVREYVSTSGVVFGVAWNGPVPPDLTALLGSYADEYRKAQSQTPRQPGRRHAQVKTNRVVVERWGHMRNLQGRAYAPDLIPQGVSVDEIK